MSAADNRKLAEELFARLSAHDVPGAIATMTDDANLARPAAAASSCPRRGYNQHYSFGIEFRGGVWRVNSLQGAQAL